MIDVKKEGVILKKSLFDFENDGVLNPAAIKADNNIHLFYRAVRKGNHSSIGHCLLNAPLSVAERTPEAVLSPEFDYESQGVEDPRIVRIDDLYYLSYTAFDGVNALGALATSGDLLNFNKLGIIVPRLSYNEFNRLTSKNGAINKKYKRYNNHQRGQKGGNTFVWDKNLVFFPRRIQGKLCFLHRIRPDIQIVSVGELSELNAAFWEDYFLHFEEHVVLSPKHKHEVSYIGAGCPPIETAHGWLMIYHGVHDTVNGYVYSACAALLDLDHPGKELSRLAYPLFKPEFDWELKGEVNNVCFPTGAVVQDDTLYIYYGAADEQIACASLSMNALLDELCANITKNENKQNTA